jgi:hypothetical protein
VILPFTLLRRLECVGGDQRCGGGEI